jgi:hypothetical protein
MTIGPTYDLCTECGREITPAESALGWPILDTDRLLCPSCYGDEAWCAVCGTLMPAYQDISTCEVCRSDGY